MDSTALCPPRSRTMSPARLFPLCLFLLTAVEASLPHDLSNFHGEYICDQRVKLVRPKSLRDVKEAVRRHRRVMAVGAGKSWNRAFFCPEPTSNGETSAAIVMTTLDRQTIEVSENEMATWVSAGVVTWQLVEYLGNYITPSAPRGYALGMTPLFLNQTVVGGVSTGTHGSSLEYSSLSNQVLAFRVILADGSEMEIDQERHPLYFRAFKVNVGRLGVVTDVKIKIVRNDFVKLTREVGIPFKRFISRLQNAQKQFVSTGSLPDWMDAVMFWISHTSFQVIEQRIEKVVRACDDRIEKSISKSNSTKATFAFKGRVSRGSDIPSGVDWKRPTPLPPLVQFRNPDFVISDDPSTITGLNVYNGTFPRSRGVFALSKLTADAVGFVLYDAYEYAIRADKMADCLEGAVKLLKRMKRDNGLRSSIVLRFTGKEDGLLSQAQQSPVMWLDVTEFVYYNQQVRRRNVPFQKLIAYLLTSRKCTPAIRHWGKAGWPDQGCWNGAESYGLNWCHFGCVVRDLDPENKFIGSARGTWNWKGAHLDKCCKASGYDPTIDGCDCEVVPAKKPEDCPRAPFFSNR